MVELSTDPTRPCHVEIASTATAGIKFASVGNSVAAFGLLAALA
jgi:hypothetical protein